MTEPNIRLELFETVASVPLATYSSGTFERRLFPQGNALLSTLFVHDISIGATISVSYRETTIGEQFGEDSILKSHTTPAAGTSDKIIVPKIHNKPRVVVTVTGGTATFGVYTTVISSVASDIDSSLFKDADNSNLLTDIGSQTVIFDETQGKHFFARGDAGIQDVNIHGGVKTQGLTLGGLVTEVVLNDTTWAALPANPRASRNAVSIQNFSGQLIKLNYNPETVGLVGVYVMDQNERFYDISDTILIYGKSTSGTCTIVVEEIA
jgi:hypothetical protein